MPSWRLPTASSEVMDVVFQPRRLAPQSVLPITVLGCFLASVPAPSLSMGRRGRVTREARLRNSGKPCRKGFSLYLFPSWQWIEVLFKISFSYISPSNFPLWSHFCPASSSSWRSWTRVVNAEHRRSSRDPGGAAQQGLEARGQGGAGQVGWAGSFPQDKKGIEGGGKGWLCFYLGKGYFVADIGDKWGELVVIIYCLHCKWMRI